MKEQAIKNFAAVLVHNFYENNPNPSSDGAALISDILMQIREAGELDNPVTLDIDHEKAVFTSTKGAITDSYTFKHEEFPSNTDKEDVKDFVRKILTKVFY